MVFEGIFSRRTGLRGPVIRWSSVFRMLLSVVLLGMVSLPVVSENRDKSPDDRSQESTVRSVGLVTFTAGTADELCRLLSKAWSLVPEGEIPNVAPSCLPPDMASLDAGVRKSAFIRSLVPHLLEVNGRIRRERRGLLAMLDHLERGKPLSAEQMGRLMDARRRYRLDAGEGLDAGRDSWRMVSALLPRVDEIPVGLALGQAAVESAWGTSRLALRENSLFGQFVFPSTDPAPPLGKGALKPGAPARFRTIGEAVEAYSRNLNTCEAYEPFRRLRATLRQSGAAADPVVLAQGLLPYSELGSLYVANVREVIRCNAFGVVARSPLRRFRSEVVTLLLGHPTNVAALSPGEVPAV